MIGLGSLPPFDDTLDLRRRVRIASLWTGALLLIAFLAATFLKVGGAVIGYGTVSVDPRVDTITHASGGVLSRLLVKEGDRVSGGQILMRLESAVADSGANTARLNRDQLLARVARLRAERDALETVPFPVELMSQSDASKRAAVEAESRQFALRNSERRETLRLLHERISQSQRGINSYEAQINAAERQAALIESELSGLRKLHAKGLVTINRLNQAERAAIELESNVASLTANIATTNAYVAEIRQEMIGLGQSSRIAAADQLAQAEASLNEQRARLVSAVDALARETVTAPRSGVVDEIAFTTIGSAIPPTTPLVRIVPDAGPLVVEGRIRLSDIDAVEVGQEVQVRFSTIDRANAPEVPARLTFVSAVSVADAQTGESYYHVRVEVESRAASASFLKDLRPGTPVELFFQTESRTIMSYLLQPLFNQIAHALRY